MNKVNGPSGLQNCAGLYCAAGRNSRRKAKASLDTPPKAESAPRDGSAFI